MFITPITKTIEKLINRPEVINYTNIEHGIIALSIMIILVVMLGIVTQLSWGILGLCAFVPVAGFIGREHAQYEYKLIRNNPSLTHDDLSLLETLNMRKWSVDSRADVIVPAIVNTVVAVALMLILL